MAQIHTSVTLLASRGLMWSSGQLTRQHASHISVAAHISWGVTNVLSAQGALDTLVTRTYMDGKDINYYMMLYPTPNVYKEKQG